MRRNRNENRLGPLARLQDQSFRVCSGLLLLGMLASVAMVCGCAGLVTGQQQPPPPAKTYSISGTISPVAGGSGATVAVSGAASATTTTDSAGNYTFTGLVNGAYAVTPSHAGYTFTPSSQAATINGANVTGVNFTAVPQVAHSALLTWNPSTSVVSGYNIYRSTVSGASYTKINSNLLAVLTYTDTTVQNSTTYFYVATAGDANGVESANSNEVSPTIP